MIDDDGSSMNDGNVACVDLCLCVRKQQQPAIQLTQQLSSRAEVEH